MVSEALNRISEEMIKKSFRVCGFAANGVAVPNKELHSRLRNFLSDSDEESDDDSNEESDDDTDVSSEGSSFESFEVSDHDIRSTGSVEF